MGILAIREAVPGGQALKPHIFRDTREDASFANVGIGWTISGGALVFVGFAFLAADLYLIQHDEFGAPTFINRLRRMFTGPQTQVLDLEAAIGLSDAAMTVRGKVRRPPGATLETRVEALEVNFAHLAEEVDEVYKAIDNGLAKLRKDLEDSTAELDQEVKQRERDQKKLRARSQKFQGGAIVLFLAGTILSILGTV